MANPFVTATGLADPPTGQQAGVQALLRSAQANGMDARQTAALLASSFQESGWNPSAIGDHGTSFGLGQQHVGGAGGPTVSAARRYLNPTASAAEMAARFKSAGVASGRGAAASQRPADQAGYARSVQSIMDQILAGSHATFNKLVGSRGDTQSLAAGVGLAKGGSQAAAPRAKWSPERDLIRAKARQLGVPHTSGDRSKPAPGQVANSAHDVRRTDMWADDYGVSAELEAYAKSLGVETLVHDAGTGMHLHVEGKSSAGGSSSPLPGGAAGDDGLMTVGLTDDIGGAVLQGVVLLVGLALGAGLIFAGVTKITGTEKLATGAIGAVVPG